MEFYRAKEWRTCRHPHFVRSCVRWLVPGNLVALYHEEGKKRRGGDSKRIWRKDATGTRLGRRSLGDRAERELVGGTAENANASPPKFNSLVNTAHRVRRSPLPLFSPR